MLNNGVYRIKDVTPGVVDRGWPLAFHLLTISADGMRPLWHSLLPDQFLLAFLLWTTRSSFLVGIIRLWQFSPPQLDDSSFSPPPPPCFFHISELRRSTFWSSFDSPPPLGISSGKESTPAGFRICPSYCSSFSCHQPGASSGLS